MKDIWSLSEGYKLGLAEGLDKTAMRNDFLAPQPVELILPQQAGYVLELYRLPALIVYVNAPDAVILSEIKRTLKAIRKPLRPPIAKPGRAAFNSLFDAHIFAKWRSEKIVQLAELLMWRAKLSKQEAKNYPDHVLGKWLGKETPQATTKAKNTLKEALASLPALGAQVRQSDEIANSFWADDFAVSLGFFGIAPVSST